MELDKVSFHLGTAQSEFEGTESLRGMQRWLSVGKGIRVASECRTRFDVSFALWIEFGVSLTKSHKSFMNSLRLEKISPEVQAWLRR